MPRLPLFLLVAVLAVSFGLHAHRAMNPTSSYQSADERSYGKLAVNLAEHLHYGDRSMRAPLHWPPGAPVLFAAGHRLFGSEASARSYDIPAAYWLHAVLAIGTALGAFLFARALAGVWAGVAAGALVALYPPLILATGEQVSEPFGAFLFMWAMALLAVSAQRRWLPGYAAAGALLGATVLTRADLLFAPGIVAVLAAGWLWWRRRDVRRGALVGGLIAGGAALVMVPWVAYASATAGKLVPVTQGSAAPLFVGTYLPGGGHTVGMKRALEDEVKRFRPSLRGTPAFEIPARNYMDMIAARHPDLPRDAAIRREARSNLVEYATGDPAGFAVMLGDKVQRMWTRYARGGARPTSPWIRAWHVALVLMAFAGCALGVLRGRSLLVAAVLLVALYSTALHMLVVSQARYNLPLMPALMSAGIVGWVLWRRARVAAEACSSETSPRASTASRMPTPTGTSSSPAAT